MSGPAESTDLHIRVFSRIAGTVDGSGVLTQVEQQHIEQCATCQQEVLQYRRILRTLHGLRTNVIHPAPGLLADILAGIAEKGERHAVRSVLTGRRAAYASGLAIATVAGVTGAVLLAGRTKSKSTKRAA